MKDIFAFDENFKCSSAPEKSNIKQPLVNFKSVQIFFKFKCV